MSQRYERNADVVVHEEDSDGALLFNPENDRIFVLNRTGFFVWDLCTGEHPLSRIVEGVRSAFEDVPEEDVDHQVQALIDELSRAGFLVRREA